MALLPSVNSKCRECTVTSKDVQLVWEGTSVEFFLIIRDMWLLMNIDVEWNTDFKKHVSFEGSTKLRMKPMHKRLRTRFL